MQASHGDLCADLIDQHRTLAQLESQMLSSRRDHWENSGEATVTARDRYTDHATVSLAQEIVLVRGEIRALEYALRSVEWDSHHGAR